MKAFSIISIIVASLGILFSLAMMFATTATIDDLVGYGFWFLLISGMFLALSILALKKSK